MGLGSSGSISQLNAAYVLVGASEAAVLPFIPLFLLERGFGASAIGVVLSAAALASFVAGPAWAYLADHKLGAERTVVVAAATAAASALLLAAVRTSVEVAAVTVALLAARAPFMSLLDTIALQTLGAGGRVGYPRIRLRTSAGWAASVVVSGGLFQAAGLKLIPFVYAPMAVLFGLWVWRVLARGVAGARKDRESRRALRLRSMPTALFGFLVSVLLLGSAFAASLNFVTLRINVLGGGALLIGAAAAFQALTEIPTMAYTHVLMRYLSHRMLYVAGAGVYLFVFVAWAFVPDAFATALLRLVVGVGFALTYVAAVLIADDVAPARLRATVQALVKSVSGLAPVFGALGGGVIYGAFGPSAMFLTAAAVTAGAGIVALIAVPERRPRQDSMEEGASYLTDAAAGDVEPAAENGRRR